MIADSLNPARFEGGRWKIVRRGLRLANSCLGAGAIGGFYALWCVIGLILALALIPFVFLGKVKAFESALNPVALYGFLLPLGLIAVTTWAVKLFARLLWCAIPEPAMARFLALVAVLGRLSVAFAAVHILLWGGPYKKGLLLPETVACSALAWLGLLAEWAFVRILRAHLLPSPGPVWKNTLEPAREKVQGDPGEEKSLFKRDLGDWFRRRFPRTYKSVAWIVLPVAYVTVSSMAEDGDIAAVFEAVLRLVILAPALLQVFWIPGDALGSVIDAFTDQRNRQA